MSGDKLFGVKLFHAVCIVVIDDVCCEEGVANNQQKMCQVR